MSLKVRKTILWYIYLFNCAFHLIILLLSYLYSISIINLENFGITEYVTDYIPRIFIVVILFLISLSFIIKRKYYDDFDWLFILFLLSAPFFLDTIGNFWALYDVNGIFGVFWYDDILHFIIPILISISFFHYLYKMRGYTKRLSILVSSTISLSLSTVWEIYEYSSDVLLGTDMVKGIADTMSDLSYALLGVCVFYVLFCIVIRG